MRRWLAVSLALLLAVVALYAMVTAPADDDHGIDEASRRKLLEVLREENQP